MRADGMRNINQILHMVVKLDKGIIFTALITPPPPALAKIFVTRMLTCDLRAAANVFVTV